MDHALGDAGRAMIKAFIAVLVVAAIGISREPNLGNLVALGLAGLCGGLAAALAALQTFLPKLSFRAYVSAPWGPMLDSFAHAAIPVFIVSITAWLNSPDLSTWSSVLVTAIVGAIAAGLRALQGALTQGERPRTTSGVKVRAGVLRSGVGGSGPSLLPA